MATSLIFLNSIIKMPLMNLPVQSVVVPVKSGRILISPGSKLDREILIKNGPYSDIVAPNLFHLGGVPKALALNPSARVWGAEGAKQKRPDILWTNELTTSTWPYNDELKIFEIKGMPSVNESVFYHAETKSLIVADLCFNLISAKGFGPWLILNLFGTYQKFAISKFFLKFTKDKAAVKNSLTAILDCDFDNIILGHGENVFGNAKTKLINALHERDLI